MSLTLHNLHASKGSKKSKKRLGRGLASKGSYSGRGVKGQRARSGVSGLKKMGIRQNMLATPKVRGFRSPHPRLAIVNLSDLSVFADGTKVSPKLLLKKGLVEDISSGVKVLAKGTVTARLTITDCEISASAKEKIEAAGGTVEAPKKVAAQKKK